jgi:hypothetical protein
VDYSRYRADFLARKAAVNLPADCNPGEPTFVFSTSYSWTLTWIISFADNQYVRIRECFGKVKGRYTAVRRVLSYHYGPIENPGNLEGKYRVGAPVVIRIDVRDDEPAHLHYLGPEPHYEQKDVKGFKLETADMFSWLEAVLKSRQTGTPIHESLKFTVQEPK